MEVHKQLGCGFLEAVYQEALALEMAIQQVPFEREVPLPVFYRGQQLGVGYRADFICFAEIVVELKALSRLSSMEEAQILNYLKATGHSTGLVLNFGGKSLEYKRFVHSQKT